MKKILIHTLVAATLTAGLSGCGDSFLETKFYKGQDIEKGLTSVPIIDAALNGAYDRFYDPRFAGNYALAIGDVSTDIAYWNGVTGHWSSIYGYSFLDTEGYLADIWEYGYKAIDNSTRVIEDASKLYASSTDAEKKSLDRDIAEAYALRGFSRLILTNIFGHQIKVNGKDFSDQPGILISDKIVGPEDQVKRATVGESYAAIVSDLKNALTRFTAAGGDRGSKVYLGVAAVHGLLARTYLYMENWDEAVAYWRTLATDDDAEFDTVVELDANELEPFVTWGTNPGQGIGISGKVPEPADIADETQRKAAEGAIEYMGLTPGTPMREIDIDAVFIGSCTNGRIEDLRAAAKVVEGRKKAPKTRVMVVPGSARVRLQAEAEGLDKVFLDFGAEWRNAGCSMCLGMNPDQLSPGERCASTSNRNFQGRQGPGGRTHLVSPLVAAATAVKGKLATPSDLG